MAYWITCRLRRQEVVGSISSAIYFLHPVSTSQIGTDHEVLEYLSKFQTQFHAHFKLLTCNTYCTSGREKITYIITLGFRVDLCSKKGVHVYVYRCFRLSFPMICSRGTTLTKYTVLQYYFSTTLVLLQYYFSTTCHLCQGTAVFLN